MHRCLLLFCLLALPARASADVRDLDGGLFGSVDDPAQSCEVRPHRLALIARPPHLVLTWPDGEEQVYDLRGLEGGAAHLEREHPREATATGAPVIWILRPLPEADGYCWGRTDWPLIRCERGQRRCPGEAATS